MINDQKKIKQNNGIETKRRKTLDEEVKKKVSEKMTPGPNDMKI